MKRIVIIEGNVSSLSRHHDEYSTSVTRGGSEVVLDLTPEAADQIGASFREPMRVVVEIGTESNDGSLTMQELRRELAMADHNAEEYQRESESLARRLESMACIAEVFDPEKHITKATVCAWLEDDAMVSDGCELECSASDTRAIIARINAHKESPGSGVIHPESHHPAGTAAKSYHPKYAGRWPTPAQRFSRGPRSGAPALRRVVAAS